MSDAYDYADADAIPPVKPKTPHALTREQCSLCTANRPRLCDQHYKQGADELLKHVTAAIQDQQTPGGVKATYEQLLELCNQQRQALAQQAQEVERLKVDMEERRNRSRKATQAIIDAIGSDGPENIDHAVGRLIAKLAAMTAERDAFRSLAESNARSIEDKGKQLATLQATLAEREARVKELEAAHFTELKERLRYTGEYRDAKRKVEQLVTDLDAARQDAARLRGILQAILNADERGQGLPFQEAMRVAYQEVKKTT